MKNDLKYKLRQFKRKYYTNMLLRGSIFFIAFVLTAFLLFNFVEYVGRFDRPFRTVLFYSFIGLAIFTLFRYIIRPIIKLSNLDRSLSDHEASRQIGNFFPEIKDKLLNTLQLQELSARQNTLVSASLDQRTDELEPVPFINAVNLSENRKYLPYALLPLLLIVGIFFINQNILTESTNRLINYNETFVPDAPFTFEISDNELVAYKNEEFTLNVDIAGNALPEQVYVLYNDVRLKMQKHSDSQYSYNFGILYDPVSFQLEASGFSSGTYEVKLISRPELKSFRAELRYPRYLNKENESLSNIGNLTVPEGTRVEWLFNTSEAQQVEMNFGNNIQSVEAEKDGENFRYGKVVKSSQRYEIQLQNDNGKNKDKIRYDLTVIKDQHPKINVEEYADTVLYSYIVFGGTISDDYGLSDLKLFYKTDKDTKKYKQKRIKINQSSASQKFYYQLSLDSAKLNRGESIEYYLTVWDNDGVNGAKSTRTGIRSFRVPEKASIQKEIEQSSKQTAQQMSKTLEQVKEFQKDVKEVEERLKSKKQLEWQDKKAVEELLKKQKKLEEELDKMNEKYEQTQEKRERFSPQNEELAEKARQLQELMNEVLDEETKKLFEELQKLMDEKMDPEELRKMMEQMSQKEDALEKNLERSIEMYKQLQFDQKLQETISELEELAEKQQKLADETEKSTKEEKDKLANEQEKLNKEFRELTEKYDELKKLDKELKNKKDIQSFDEEMKEVNEKMEGSKESIEDGKQKQGSKQQKDAADDMKKMAEKMQEMTMQMEMEAMQENMDDLRQILENLITLSFDQEELMEEFKEVRQSDPRFVELGQKQLKLKDDAKVIEDSLYALAERVFQIKAFVTEELQDMKEYMNESVAATKERQPAKAAGKQQFAMTSMNNLALMLNDVLSQMQQQMANQMQGKQNCTKPGGGKPNLSEMQKQLNQQIEGLKKGNMTGRELSQQLAKMAAQQEMIRRALKKMEREMMGEGDKPGGDMQKLQEQMEQTEKDLVNKNLNTETVKRQKEILTRLLEAEKSMRERDLDDKRESKTAQETPREIPPEIEKYLKEKEKQIELLKTIPPQLNEYYKRKANEYFESIEK